MNALWWEKIRNILFQLKKLRRQITYSEAFIDFLAFLVFLIINLYTKTLKIRYYFHPDFLKLDRTKVCYGFWHGRQFLLVPSFGRWNVALMSDLSWAGEIQTRILRRFGYEVVRGSSKRKGAEALLNIKKTMNEGCSGAFALDGPRGPIYKAKPGILFLAKKLGFPIIPLTSSADRAWVFKRTWCQYLLPKPFSRCYVAMGRPLWEAGMTLEALNHVLIEWTAEIDWRTGRYPEPI